MAFCAKGLEGVGAGGVAAAREERGGRGKEEGGEGTGKHLLKRRRLAGCHHLQILVMPNRV